MNYRLIVLVASVLMWTPALVRAGVIINVGDAIIQPGGTASIDVSIESDGNDSLQSFGFEFRIATAGSTRLEFRIPQLDSQLMDLSYIFIGESFNLINGFNVGVVSMTNLPKDTFIGGDSTDSFSEVPMTSNKLLVRLDLTTQTTLAPQLGDIFEVTLDEASPYTFFADASLNSLVINTFGSDLSGTIRVTESPSVVPEPSSILTWSMIGGFGMFYRHRRKRFTTPSINSPGIS